MYTPTTRQIFESLLGSWTFERVIRPGGSIKGTVEFLLKDPNTYSYKEEGTFLNERSEEFETSREYLYCYRNNTIEVLFSDGKSFLTLEFISPQYAIGTHTCSEDNYEAFYSFLSPISFTVEYSVKGPRKEYEMLTFFTR